MSKLADLQSQIHYYQQMINLIPNEMYVKNNQGVYLIVNQFYTEKLVVLGKPILIYFVGKPQSNFLKMISRSSKIKPSCY